MSQQVGYSGTPLVRKLGVKAGHRVQLTNAPANYSALLAPFSRNVQLSTRFRQKIDIWHIFTRSNVELTRLLAQARQSIKSDGMIWVSWPKKSSGAPSEICEDDIRAVALPLGLVDIKVCAVDQTWSGLNLVIRKELR